MNTRCFRLILVLAALSACADGALAASAPAMAYDVRSFGAVGDGIADDTAKIAAAIAAAAAAGGSVGFPPGKYLIDGGLDLAHVSLIGPEVGDGKKPYTDMGAQIWQKNTDKPMFIIAGPDVTVRGLTFYYPEQDGSAETPIAYAPTFQCSNTVSCGDLNFDHCQWTNAYRCIEIKGTSTNHGRVIISGCRAYAIQHFLEAENVADVIHVSDFEITPGIWQDVALTGKKHPAKWTEEHGEAFRLTTLCDGLFLNNGIVFGYGKGVECVSGNIDWLSCHGVAFDQCVRGIASTNAGVINCVVSGCQFWAMDPYTKSAPCYGIDLEGAPKNGDLTITGNVFAYSNGGDIQVADQALQAITITGNRFKHWGKATGVATDQYAILLRNAAGADAVISGNSFLNSDPAYGVAVGILADSATVNNNTFRGAKACVEILGAGAYVVCANASTATAGPANIAGTGYTSLVHIGNSWDGGGAAVSTTATLDFPEMPRGTSAMLDVPVPGAKVGEAVSLGLPESGAHSANGIVFQAWVVAPGAVRVQALNFTTVAVDPSPMSVRIALAHE